MLSTFAKPTIDLVIPATVPVKVGLLIGAFNANELVTSVAFAFSAKAEFISTVFMRSASAAFTALESAFKSKAVWVAVLTGLFASVVLSTFARPTIDLVIPETVPVKVGLLIGAFSAKPGTVGELAVPPKSPAN